LNLKELGVKIVLNLTLEKELIPSKNMLSELNDHIITFYYLTTELFYRIYNRMMMEECRVSDVQSRSIMGNGLRPPAHCRRDNAQMMETG